MDYSKISAYVTTVIMNSKNIDFEKTMIENEETLNILKQMDFNGDPCLLSDNISSLTSQGND